MPYSRDSYFNPSDPYKKAWSLTPQGRTLSLSGHKTRSMYASVSSAVPLFYILMLSAISFDIYLGFSVLAKSGVNIGLIAGSVFFDFFFAVLPFIVAAFNNGFNSTLVDNELFMIKLECMTKTWDESETDFNGRISQKKAGVIKNLNASKTYSFIFRIILIILIFAIAGWKIYTYHGVLPPGINIFSVVNGKIVLIFSLLCAICHILGSEKAIAHMVFWMKNRKEFNAYNELHNGQVPPVESLPVKFEGDYKPTKFKNTELKVDENGRATIDFIHLIWDDEIKALIDRQGDDNAKRGVAITCKLEQIF